ncbi:unnamed protein product [Vicia faba]|uniref:Uncharacterized protein n=1 Tax=Vicia faba TaxID=3906 RepID=A0AAV0ZFR9_VICFA|nr:unnamed protein product [Vicia faba]
MWPATLTCTPNPSFFLFLPSNNRPTPRRFLHLSRSSPPDFNGWALLDTPAHATSSNIPTPNPALVALGTSLALMLACFSLSRKGFNIQFTSPLQQMWSTITNPPGDPDQAVEFYQSNETTIESLTETEATEKPARVTIPISVDSTQEEALSVLKKLKIIEDDVDANELCTRREFARWLVKLNSSLERLVPVHRARNFIFRN